MREERRLAGPGRPEHDSSSSAARARGRSRARFRRGPAAWRRRARFKNGAGCAARRRRLRARVCAREVPALTAAPPSRRRRSRSLRGSRRSRSSAPRARGARRVVAHDRAARTGRPHGRCARCRDTLPSTTRPDDRPVGVLVDVLAANPRASRARPTPAPSPSSGTSRRTCPCFDTNSPRPSRAGDLAGDEVHSRASHERRDEQIGGSIVDLGRRADLADVSPVHDDDPIGEAHRFFLIVGDVDGRHADASCSARMSSRIASR